MTVAALLVHAPLWKAGVGPICLGIVIAFAGLLMWALGSMGVPSKVEDAILGVIMGAIVLAGIVFALYGVYLVFFS